MLKFLLTVGMGVVFLGGSGQSVWGQAGVDYLEVITVEPSRQITHDVELKDMFDTQVGSADLAGPKLFSHGVGIAKKSAAQPSTYLNWYAITRPIEGSTRVISVRDKLRGPNAYEITINTPAYLLSPAQRVATGSPTDIPKSLNYFKAYSIVEGDVTKRDIELVGAFGTKPRRVVKAAYFCVPVEHWHHHEHSPVKRIDDCFVVYELEPEKIDETITTLDQFGLNKLKALASTWLCVPAQIAK